MYGCFADIKRNSCVSDSCVTLPVIGGTVWKNVCISVLDTRSSKTERVVSKSPACIGKIWLIKSECGSDVGKADVDLLQGWSSANRVIRTAS